MGERTVGREGARGGEVSGVFGLGRPGGPAEARTMSGAKAQQTSKKGQAVHKKWEARRGDGGEKCTMTEDVMEVRDQGALILDTLIPMVC